MPLIGRRPSMADVIIYLSSYATNDKLTEKTLFPHDLRSCFVFVDLVSVSLYPKRIPIFDRMKPKPNQQIRNGNSVRKDQVNYPEAILYKLHLENLKSIGLLLDNSLDPYVSLVALKYTDTPVGSMEIRYQEVSV